MPINDCCHIDHTACDFDVGYVSTPYMVTLTSNSSFFLTTWEIISLYMRRMTNYIDLNWKTEEKFNIGSKYQPSVYHNVDNTDIS